AEQLGLEAVPDEIKQERWERFMAHQQAGYAARLQQKIGRTLQVLIDEVDEDRPIARCMGDAPENDREVDIDSDEPLNPGDIVSVRVTAADEYDLWAELV